MHASALPAHVTTTKATTAPRCLCRKPVRSPSPSEAAGQWGRPAAVMFAHGLPLVSRVLALYAKSPLTVQIRPGRAWTNGAQHAPA